MSPQLCSRFVALTPSRYDAYRPVFTNPVHQRAVVRRLKLYIIVSGLLTASTFLAIVSPFTSSNDVNNEGIAASDSVSGDSETPSGMPAPPHREPARPLTGDPQISSYIRALCSISFVFSLSCITAAFAYTAVIINRNTADCADMFPSTYLLDDLEGDLERTKEQERNPSTSSAAAARSEALMARIGRIRGMNEAGHTVLKGVILAEWLTALTLAMSFAAVLAAVVLALAAFVARGAAIFALAISAIALLVIYDVYFSTAFVYVGTLSHVLGAHPSQLGVASQNMELPHV